MNDPLHIALIGCGTVGKGVARLLLDQAERLRARAGRDLVLRKVVVRDASKPRPSDIDPQLFTTDFCGVAKDPSIHVAVELVGGVDWTLRAVLDLLEAGKHVVTANKALLARHGAEVFDTARRYQRTVAFEASVGGGIPIVVALSQGLAANQILALQGILNGTSNFILTAMTDQGVSYADALKEAQHRGYAEADATLDVNGTDAVHKLAILAQIAFGISVPLPAIERRGIAELHEMDIRFARELGYTIKLLAEAWLDIAPGEAGQPARKLCLHVSPVLMRHQTPLAQVRGAYNAVHVVGDAVGDTLYYGKGAGQMPTASSVVADLIDIAVGRAQRTFQTMRLWGGRKTDIDVQSSASVRSRFYFRLLVADQPGVLAEVARILATHDISISSVIQHEALDEHEGDVVPLVIMTHTARTESFRAAMAEINELGQMVVESIYFPVAD